MRIRMAMTVVVALAALAGVGAYLGLRHGDLPLPQLGPACTVVADGEVSLDADQMANAATIAAVGIRRKVPEQGIVIALATAFQESKLRNLTGGDRDSIGLFQQRPSQGWGTADEIGDPRYASGRFYAALVKVPGWQTLRVTEAAQRVQRSAYPEAYERWAEEAAVLANALLGDVTGAVACTLRSRPSVRGSDAATALTAGLRRDWGAIPVASPAAQLIGLTVGGADARIGWRYAHWLVAHAEAHGVKRVRFASLEWTAQGGAWSQVSGGSRQNNQVVAEVHG